MGSGTSHEAAVGNALHAIASRFSIDVQAVQQLTTAAGNMTADDISSWTDRTDYQLILGTALRMDNLMGFQVRESWNDGRGTFYVRAVLDIAGAIMMYTNRILANLDVIENLTNMTPIQLYTFDGIARFRFAAIFADLNITYSEIIVMALDGEPWGDDPPLRRGEFYLQRANEIIREIPIGINVRNDRANGIQGAFASALAAHGFRSAGVNPRFVLDVDASIWLEEESRYIAWIYINANLTDTHTRAVLLQYSFNERGVPGSRSVNGAENRAFNLAINRISREYGNRVSGFLAQLVPQR
jgi:hypothetical protein